jgi:hypothetical protein
VHRDFLIAVVLLASACASHSASLPEAPLMSETAAPTTGCAAAGGSSTRSVITATELQRTNASNLYDAIRGVRPGYLAPRRPTRVMNQPETGIVVIVNRHVIGDVDELASMGVTGLVCVRRLSSADVALITGTTALDGGIELVH